MCFFYSITKENKKDLLINSIATSQQLDIIEDVYFANGFAHPQLPVLVREGVENIIKYYYWGFIPSFTKSVVDAKKIRNLTLNARAEDVFEKKTFQNSIIQRRCAVLCSGFYEFYDTGTKKYPFFITLKNNALFLLAGIFDSWKNSETNEIIHTFSIITQESNELIGAIHKKQRMPVILDYESTKLYLNSATEPAEISEIINTPINFNKMKACSIARFNPRLVNENNTPNIKAFYSYPELSDFFRFDKDFNDDIRNGIRY